MTGTLLSIRGVKTFYGRVMALKGVDLDVKQGEIVTLIGANGAGKSTLMMTVCGNPRAREGVIEFDGRDITHMPTHEIARRGLAYVPESRDVFPSLTVEQNLLLGRKSGRPPADGWRFDDVYALFPALQKRRKVAAGALSGGEQQMLALARALMGNPRLMLIDEPTEGLSPQMVEQVAHCLTLLRQRRVAVLLIEQKQSIALALSQRVYVMGRGAMVFHGTPAALQADTAVQRDWLAV